MARADLIKLHQEKVGGAQKITPSKIVETGRTVKTPYETRTYKSTEGEEREFADWKKKEDYKHKLTKGGKTLPAKAAEDISNLINTIDNMELLKNELQDKQYKIGAHMKVVPWEALQYIDPDMTAWLAGVDTHFHKNIRKPITGAQAATNELSMLRPLAPSGADTPENFMKKSDKTIAGAKRALNTALKVYKAMGYNTDDLSALASPYQGEATGDPLGVLK